MEDGCAAKANGAWRMCVWKPVQEETASAAVSSMEKAAFDMEQVDRIFGEMEVMIYSYYSVCIAGD